MRIAVLMSTYNGEKYIKEQIDSILAQKCDFPLDLWVRDDGSTDSTLQILQEYQNRGALQWYAGENLKPAHSFWDLLRHCPGYDFYAFADQDDVWHDNKVMTAVRTLMDISHNEKPALYFANARLVDGELSYLGRNVYKRTPHTDFYSLVCNGGILGCTICINAPLAQLVQNAPVPEHMIMHDAFVSVVCTMHDGIVHFDPEAYIDYRQHGNNVVGSKWNKMDALKDRIKTIRTPRKVSIADQSRSLLACFPDLQDNDKNAFLQQVAHYRDSQWKALRLSLSRKPKYNGKNMAVTAKLAILFRNR